MQGYSIKEAIERVEQKMRNLEKQMDVLLLGVDKTGNEKCPALTQYDKLREDHDQLKEILDIFKNALDRSL